ncbi:thioredoxin family protein [Enterococcus sp. AZ194]|uniref:thioredoxin family protein n=1 Tax=Enterococcus sp. AZ194 TaxID=2774629 RepID=UPI003F688F27
MIPEVYDILNSVSIENFSTDINKSSEVIYYIGRTNCSDCSNFEPDFLNFVKKNSFQKKINYLNIMNLYTDDVKWDRFKEQYSIEYTPSLVTFNNGKVSSKLSWTPENGINNNEVFLWIKNQIKENYIDNR